MLKARDQFKEAANVYFRVSGEVMLLPFSNLIRERGFKVLLSSLPQEPLQSAVMLEQASYCYLFSVPQMLRKYGFHLILSGDSYRKCDQVHLSKAILLLSLSFQNSTFLFYHTHQMKHAIRTYKTALSVFRGTSWGLIRDHIHFQLGK